MSQDDPTPRPLRNRRELIAALKFASIIEQMLACEYLFAAFSAKKTLDDYPAGTRDDRAKTRRAQADLDTIRPWLAQTYTIARQEMEHLGIVQNLLAALGEEPYFMRPAFPVSSEHTFLGAPFRLDRFGQRALHRFIWYERPDYLTEEFRRHHGDQEENHLADLVPEVLPPWLRRYDSVTKLYTAIRDAFTHLDPSEVFTGEPARQLGSDLFGYRVVMMPVNNRESAAAAVDLILEQGEGIGETPVSGEPAHFERFLAILRGYDEAIGADGSFEPALPVVSNPWIAEAGHGITNVNEDKITRITNPHAVQAMHLFNEAYSLMLVMMKSFFGTYSAIYQPQPRPQAAMFYAAFFPLMTMVIRPLGEIIARLPADGDNRQPEPGQPRAGAGFEITPEAVEPGPGPRIKAVLDADYYRDALQHQAAQAKALADAVPDDQRDNVDYLYENLTSTAGHLESIWRKGR